MKRFAIQSSSTLFLALALGGCAVQTGSGDPTSTSTTEAPGEGTPARQPSGAVQPNSAETAAVDTESAPVVAPDEGPALIDGVKMTGPTRVIRTNPDGTPTKFEPGFGEAPIRPESGTQPLPWTPH